METEAGGAIELAPEIFVQVGRTEGFLGGNPDALFQVEEAMVVIILLRGELRWFYGGELRWFYGGSTHIRVHGR